MIRTADVSGLADFRLSSHHRQAWLTWGRRHGIDGNEWLLSPGGRIETDDTARTVRYITWHRLPALEVTGRPASGMHLASACPDPQHTILRDVDADICVRWVTIQLESPAMPFPAEPMPWAPEPGSRPGAYTLTEDPT